MRKEITEDQITELMRAIPRAEEVDRLRGEVEKLTRERDEARAEVDRLRETLKIAASYVNSCYHEWYQPHDLAEALRDLTKIREVLNDERAGELEGKP